ncbi:hypothetical protein BT93_L2924 [Corymbia citriodora subsp. variegata]|uniref:Uncharacterized protein n=1 Tax=Corymbia citriodora subsp. variegata TaxID=360336 RepID=A0A8T0CYI2_CORYI|nr:hypothetical protein BT93_L2924 [Corymbia citriodora subsp. variegata]
MAGASAAGDAPDLSPSMNEENPLSGTSETRKPPLGSLAILRKAIGNEIKTLKEHELSRRVYDGVLLQDEEEQGEAGNSEDQGLPYTHKYWVHDKLNKNCWMVLAKVLSISSVHDRRCWKWTEEEEKSYHPENRKICIAELDKVSLLEISGKCKTIVLSPKTAYEVEIFVKMKPESSGWEVPVSLSLTLPDGNKQGRMEFLDRLEKDKWLPISIGKFETTPKTVGEISFSLTQTDGHSKSGLLVKGVVFTPIPEVSSTG